MQIFYSPYIQTGGMKLQIFSNPCRFSETCEKHKNYLLSLFDFLYFCKPTGMLQTWAQWVRGYDLNFK